MDFPAKKIKKTGIPVKTRKVTGLQLAFQKCLYFTHFSNITFIFVDKRQNSSKRHFISRAA